MNRRPSANTAGQNSRQAYELLNGAQGLVRRHRPDQALVSLNTAVQLFKQAGDLKGEAAAHDALGDLYSFYGPYRTAVREYQSAQGILRAANQKINADLVLAKLGNLYYLMEQPAASGAAYAQVESRHQVGATLIHGDASSGGNSSTDQAPLVTAAGEEQRAFEMVNAARQAKNLKLLTWDSQLTLMARAHSENMSRANFRGHVDQNGLDMQERARTHKLRNYEEIGENIGHSAATRPDPVAFAVETWLNDAVHRDILLYENFTHAGMGIAKMADGGLLFTQVFIRRLPTTPPAGNASAVNRQAAASVGLNKKENAADTSPGVGAGKDADLYRAFICYAKREFGLGRVAYRDGRLDDANKHFGKLLAAAAEDNSPMGELAQMRRFRIVALTSLGDVAFRKAMLPAATAAPQRFHHGGGQADANAAARKAMLQDALRLYRKAISSASKDRRPDLLWAAQRGIGRTQFALAAREPDQTQAAALREEGAAVYRAAVSAIESFLLGSIRSDEARKSFLSPTQAVFDETTGALAELALKTSPPSSTSLAGASLAYAASALQTVEQGRARALLDVLDEARAEISDGIPAELTKRKTGIQTRQGEITGLIDGVRLDGALTLNSVKALEAEFEELESQYLEVENQIRDSSPRYSTLTKPQPLTVGKLQQDILDAQTVLLEYSLGDENSYLWLVTQSSIKLFRLPGRATIEGKVAELRSKLVPSDRRLSILSVDEAPSQTARGLSKPQTQRTATAVAPANYLAAAHDLYRVVVEPAAPDLRDRRLLIVADGALHFIPFEALVTSREGESYAALGYLVKSNEVIYAPSASVLAAIQRRASASTTERGQILLLADPVFDTADERVRQSAAAAAGGLKQPAAPRANLRLVSTLEDLRGADAGALKLARLKGTRVETEQIVKLASSTNSSTATLLDLEASETTLAKQDLSKYDILHFATHGLMNPERPQFTGLALSLVGDEDNDGLLLVDEVFNLRLSRPRLVMLSACETGLGKLNRGEGVTGLTRAFMYAGATTVGVSLWSVSDEATAMLMSSFYQRLFSGKRPSMSAALRGAQLEMIAGERNSPPFYWAPFVLVGEGHY